MKSPDLEPRLKDLKWLLAIVLLVGAFAHLQSNEQTYASLPIEPASHAFHVEGTPDPEENFAVALYMQSTVKLEATAVIPRSYTLNDYAEMVTVVEQSMIERGLIHTVTMPRSVDLLPIYEMAAGVQGTVSCEKDLRLATPFTWQFVAASQVGQAMFTVAHETVHLALQRCLLDQSYLGVFSHGFESDAQFEASESLSYLYYTTTDAATKERSYLGVIFGLQDISRQALLHGIISTDYCKSRIQRENVLALFGGDSCNMKWVDMLLRETSIEGYNKYGALPLRFIMDGNTDEIPFEHASRILMYSMGLNRFNGLKAPYLEKFLDEFYPSLSKQR